MLDTSLMHVNENESLPMLIKDNVFLKGCLNLTSRIALSCISRKRHRSGFIEDFCHQDNRFSTNHNILK